MQRENSQCWMTAVGVWGLCRFLQFFNENHF